jgi:hypothetical protein
MIARRCDAELPEATLVAFMAAHGWSRGAGESLWMHVSGTRASRLEALTASLTAHHEAQHQWPAFWDHQAPATGRPGGAAGLAEGENRAAVPGVSHPH